MIISSKGYIFVKKPPSHGIFDRPGTVNLADTPRTILFEGVPLMALLAALVKKEVRATASMLMTTPLIT